MFYTNARTIDIAYKLLHVSRMSQHMMEEVQTPHHYLVITNSSPKTKPQSPNLQQPCIDRSVIHLKVF